MCIPKLIVLPPTHKHSNIRPRTRPHSPESIRSHSSHATLPPHIIYISPKPTQRRSRSHDPFTAAEMQWRSGFRAGSEALQQEQRKLIAEAKKEAETAAALIAADERKATKPPSSAAAPPPLELLPTQSRSARTSYTYYYRRRRSLSPLSVSTQSVHAVKRRLSIVCNKVDRLERWQDERREEERWRRQMEVKRIFPERRTGR